MPKLTKIHSARVISIQQPVPEIVEELGVDSPEGLTAYITRVSNPSNQGSENIGKLITYCCKHGHWSILEHINMTMEILTTRDISAQICRHHSFRFQEFSQRYSETSNFDVPFEVPQLRLQDPKNRQKSITVDDDHIIPWGSVELNIYDVSAIIEFHMKGTYALYEKLLKAGVAKECARRILPMSSTTKLYMTGNIRSWLFYIKARNTFDGKAQVEHNWVADACQEYFRENFPIVYSATFLDDIS